MQPINPCLGVTKEFKESNSYSGYEDFLWIGHTLSTKKFKYASTMSWAPHWYSVRSAWNTVEKQLMPLRDTLYNSVYCVEGVTEEQKRKAYEVFEKEKQKCIKSQKYIFDYKETDEEFAKVVQYIRKYGYNEKFGKTMYRCFDIDAMKYWTMGYPVEMTYILNRTYRKTPFDAISYTYDDKYSTQKYLMSDNVLSDVIRNYYSEEGDVLEVGCATGTFSNLYVNYTGIDKSGEMVKKAQEKFPDKQFQTASLESYYTRKKYDFIFMTYGTASYINEEYILTKLFDHLVQGGKFLLTYINNGDSLLFEMKHILKFVHFDKKIDKYRIIGGSKNDD
jgi:ubiquinone/menaquinone biosynthesis C-methylase UbiE